MLHKKLKKKGKKTRRVHTLLGENTVSLTQVIETLISQKK